MCHLQIVKELFLMKSGVLSSVVLHLQIVKELFLMKSGVLSSVVHTSTGTPLVSVFCHLSFFKVHCRNTSDLCPLPLVKFAGDRELFGKISNNGILHH